MRRLLPLLALLVVMPVAAQNAPQGSQPLPAPPPPPPGIQDFSAPQPQITIVHRGQDKIEEYRANGRLYMLKVTPPHGKPYYLVNERGDGQWARQDSLDTGLRVPMWVIHRF